MISEIKNYLRHNTIHTISVMDNSLNFVALVESSPITRLNRDYNNKFVNIIKETFTETQQQLFVSSLYCFLNYHPTNDFVIDLDNVWKWLGFQQKYHAKTCLEKYFIMDKDYKILLPQSREQVKEQHGGHNKQTILLNVQTFKLFCIKADTKKAHEIHEYFIKLEELMQTIVQEESNELKLQLEQINQQNIRLENNIIKTQQKYANTNSIGTTESSTWSIQFQHKYCLYYSCQTV